MCNCTKADFDKTWQLAKLYSNEFKVDVVIWRSALTGWHFSEKKFAIENKIKYEYEYTYIP